MKLALLSLVLLTSCIAVPDRATSLPLRNPHDALVMTGAGNVEWHEDGSFTLRGGPGALVVALAERDYRVRVEVNVEARGNSGVFVRSAEAVMYPRGIEVQIDPADPKNPTGSIYNRVRSAAPVPPAGTWFALVVVVNGSRVESFVNDVAAARIDDVAIDGPLFALQAHDPGSVVHFRNLLIEGLP